MKSVLISIQPKWCKLIASGKKTIEVRKTAPKLETPFKCYIYCTQGKYNPQNCGKNSLHDCFTMEGRGVLNGKVIGEFVCDSINEIYTVPDCDITVQPLDLIRKACLLQKEAFNYLGWKDGYAWHISDLKIYDKPKELGEFYHPVKYDKDGNPICGTAKEIADLYEWDCESVFGVETYGNGCLGNNCPRLKKFCRIKRPPQSWCYVEAV